MSQSAKRRKLRDDVVARKRNVYPIGYRSRRGMRVYGPYMRLGTPLGTKQYANFRYHDQITLTPGTGASAVHVFSANGLYDPDISGVGHQPRGFDQVMALYDHFVVIGSKITATISAISGETLSTLCGISLRDGSTAETDPNDYMEGGSTISRMLSVDGGSRSISTMKMGYSPKRFLGRSHPLADPQLKGSSSSDPEESAFFHVWAAPATSSGDQGPLDCVVTIDYLAVFIEPKDVSQS